MKPTVLTRRPWIIADARGSLIDDIDTDQTYHNRHLAVTDPKGMAKYAFGNLMGWEEFPKVARPGDVLFVGEDFGAGPSRPHALDRLVALGIVAPVGSTFGAIYKRNAINPGFPLLTLPGMSGGS